MPRLQVQVRAARTASPRGSPPDENSGDRWGSPSRCCGPSCGSSSPRTAARGRWVSPREGVGKVPAAPGVVEVHVQCLLAAEAAQGRVAADLGDVQEGSGVQGFAALGIDACGEADDGAVVSFVELQAAHYPDRAADGVYLLSIPGDDEMALRGAHGFAFSYGDHARLYTPLCYRRSQALPDALREV